MGPESEASIRRAERGEEGGEGSSALAGISQQAARTGTPGAPRRREEQDGQPWRPAAPLATGPGAGKGSEWIRVFFVAVVQVRLDFPKSDFCLFPCALQATAGGLGTLGLGLGALCFLQDPSRMCDGFSDGQRKRSSGRILFPWGSACPQGLGLLAPTFQVRTALLRRQMRWRHLAAGPRSQPALRATSRGLLLRTLGRRLGDLEGLATFSN